MVTPCPGTPGAFLRRSQTNLGRPLQEIVGHNKQIREVTVERDEALEKCKRLELKISLLEAAASAGIAPLAEASVVTSPSGPGLESAVKETHEILDQTAGLGGEVLALEEYLGGKPAALSGS